MSTVPSDAESRYEREAEFHDHTFGEETRASVGKFYAATQRALRRYGEAVRRAPAGARILEYGCGPGSLAFDLAREGYEVTGIDISPIAMQLASDRAAAEGVSDRATFRVMNAEDMDFDDDTFDLVCGSGIIHHLDLDVALPEVDRVLRPGGRVVFIEPLAHNPGLQLFRALTPSIRTPDEHPLTMDDLEDFERRFTPSSLEFHGMLTLGAMPAYGRQRFTPLLNRLEDLDDAVFARVPWLRRWAWLSLLEGTASAKAPAAA